MFKTIIVYFVIAYVAILCINLMYIKIKRWFSKRQINCTFSESGASTLFFVSFLPIIHINIIMYMMYDVTLNIGKFLVTKLALKKFLINCEIV